MTTKRKMKKITKFLNLNKNIVLCIKHGELESSQLLEIWFVNDDYTDIRITCKKMGVLFVLESQKENGPMFADKLIVDRFYRSKKDAQKWIKENKKWGLNNVR